VHLSEDDMKLLAQKGVWIVHNPSSNLKLANGIAPVARMLQNGCKVLLGTDSVASNNSLDIWREMLLTALVQKGFFHDPTLLPASQVLKMAGPDAYQAIGFPDGGILKPGNLADLVLLELHPIDFFPPEQLLSHLVYSGGSAHVFATMVDGNWVYYDGAFPTIDADEVFFYLGRRHEVLREK